jgi:hypothetical protein
MMIGKINLARSMGKRLFPQTRYLGVLNKALSK